MQKIWIVPPHEAGKRLDAFLARVLGEACSRSHVARLIRSGLARVGGTLRDPDTPVKAGDRVELDYREREGPRLNAEPIPLSIVHEDDDLLIIDKASGMVVHPGKGNWEHTLVHAVLHHVRGRLSAVGGKLRPGIVHRLDKGTSGLLVVAKHDLAHRALAKQFADRTAVRIYRVFVSHVVAHDEGFIDQPLGRSRAKHRLVVVTLQGGRAARTSFKVCERFARATELAVELQTGRTHQIRAHLAHAGHAVLGDVDYGSGRALIGRPAVHAERLGFVHPRSRLPVMFESPLPADLVELREKLRQLK